MTTTVSRTAEGHRTNILEYSFTVDTLRLSCDILQKEDNAREKEAPWFVELHQRFLGEISPSV